MLVTGNKFNQKLYRRHTTGRPGSMKIETFKDLQAVHNSMNKPYCFEDKPIRFTFHLKRCLLLKHCCACVIYQVPGYAANQTAASFCRLLQNQALGMLTDTRGCSPVQRIPERIIEKAVKGMLTRGRLGNALFRHLKVVLFRSQTTRTYPAVICKVTASCTVSREFSLP